MSGAPKAPQPSPQPAYRAGPRALLLPLVLWFAATLFFRGDIGKWNDDYFFYGQFNPETGQVRSYPLDRDVHYWRPLYKWVNTPINTLFFGHDAINHVLTACVHGLVSLLVFVLLRGFGRSRLAGAMAAMLFLTFPVHFEVPLWNTAMATGLATALVVVIGLVYLRVLSAAGGVKGGRVFVASFVCSVLAFASASFNEQPAAALAALGVPAAAWLVSRRRERGGVARREVAGAFMPLLASGLALAVYVAIHSRLHPAHPGRAIGNTVPLDDFGRRLGLLLQQIESHITLSLRWRGELQLAWSSIRGRGPFTILIVAIAALGFVWWFRRGVELRGQEQAERTAAAVPPWLVVITGGVWFVAAWLPIARIQYPVSPRLFYAPDVGLAVMLAGVIDGVVNLAARRHRARFGAKAAVVLATAVAVAGATLMIGVQRGYRDRWLRDEAQGAALRQLVPNPGPDSIFVPLETSDRPRLPGARAFSRHLTGALENEWSAGWYVRRLYHRSDLWAVVGTPRPRSNIAPVDADHFDVTGLFAQPWPIGRNPHPRLDWSRIVPLEIDEAGTVHVVTKVRAEIAPGTYVEIAPPQTAALAAAGSIPRYTYQWTPPPDLTGPSLENASHQ